jgi:hypothetical protein
MYIFPYSFMMHIELITQLHQNLLYSIHARVELDEIVVSIESTYQLFFPIYI